MTDRTRLLALLSPPELALLDPATRALAARARRGTRAEPPEWRAVNTLPVVKDAGKRRARVARWRAGRCAA